MRARPILWFLAASALAAGAARATEKPIEVRIPDCPSAPLSLDAFLASLRVELAGRDPPCCTLASPSAGDRDEVGIPLQVTISIEPCDTGTEMVEIRVRDSAHATTADRQIALRDIPVDARPRALALAVAELVHTVSQPQPPRAVAPALPPPAPPSSRPVHALVWSGSFELRTHPNRNVTLWGFRPSLEAVRRHWQAAVDLEVAHGDPSVSLGDVSTSLLSATIELGPRFHLGDFALDVGVCGSLGWVWLSGHTDDPNDVVSSAGSALATSAGARVGLDSPALVGNARIRAVVEAGAMLRGVDATANDSRAASLTGAYVVIGVGVAWTSERLRSLD
jgi:hypothetical protein